MGVNFYTPEGFLIAQKRVCEEIYKLATKRGMRLESPTWNDGNPMLPKLGDTIKISFFYRGRPVTFLFTQEEWEALLSGQKEQREEVRLKLDQTLDAHRGK